MTNPVAEAIDRLGGLTAAIGKTGYSQSTLILWRRTGRIGKVEAAFKIADLTGVPVRALAGLEEWSRSPSPGSPKRKGRPSRCSPDLADARAASNQAARTPLYQRLTGALTGTED